MLDGSVYSAPRVNGEISGGQSSITGNFTLLDIAKALDWVRDNIAQFGGDPDNITVSGFSAGGRDVMAMLASPMFAGRFQKAIAFSGGMTIADEAAAEAKPETKAE